MGTNQLGIHRFQVSLQTLGKAEHHGCSPGEDDVLVEPRPQVYVGVLDYLEDHLADAFLLALHQLRLEQNLSRLEPLPTQLEDFAISHLKINLERSTETEVK